MKKGYTLIETLLVMSIFISLVAIVTLTILNIEPRSAIRLNTTTVIADIKKQQLKALTGATYLGATTNFGIYFQSDKYTLFAGDNYSGGNASNVEITLPQKTIMSGVTFPSATIVFAKYTGEINNFINGSNTLTFQNSVSNEAQTITLNKLGVITSVN